MSSIDAIGSARTEPVSLTWPRRAGTAGSVRAAASEPQPGAAPADEAARVTAELAELSPRVTFSVDQENGDVVVKLLDPRTREVVRQIPPEELLRLRRHMAEYLGMLADEAA